MGKIRLAVFALLMLLAGVAAQAQTTHTVCTSGCTFNNTQFQAAIAAAACGDTITLEAGITYSGNFTLPNKSCAGPAVITIKSNAALGSLPSVGLRITPTYTSFLPVIKSPNSSPAILVEESAAYYKFQYIKFDGNPQGIYSIFQIGTGAGQTKKTQEPHHITIDQVYFTANRFVGMKRAVDMNGHHITITNSWCENMNGLGQDSQCFGGFNGSGDFVIDNNYLDASGENIIFGGSDPEERTYLDVTGSGSTTGAAVATSEATHTCAELFIDQLVAIDVVPATTTDDLEFSKLTNISGPGATCTLTWSPPLSTAVTTASKIRAGVVPYNIDVTRNYLTKNPEHRYGILPVPTGLIAVPAGGGAGGVIHTETFTGANDTDIETHDSDWVEDEGLAEIISNRGGATSPGNIAYVRLNVTTENDQAARANIYSAATGFQGVFVRGSMGASGPIGYHARLAGTTLYLLKYTDSWGPTTLGFTTVAAVAGQLLEASVTGSVITVSFAGTPEISVNDTSSPIASGQTGFVVVEASNIDNFEAENLSGGGGGGGSLSAGTYQYRVHSINNASYGGSQIQSADTAAVPATLPSTGQVALDVTAPLGATGYRWWRCADATTLLCPYNDTTLPTLIDDGTGFTLPATITSNSVAGPTIILTSAAHNFTTGDLITIAGNSGSVPSINGVYNITVTDSTHFSIPVTVSTGGTGGTASPTRGDASLWSIKTLFELKVGVHVNVSGNILDTMWFGETGMATRFKSANQDGACWWCQTEDVTFELNLIRHTSGCMQVSSAEIPAGSGYQRPFPLKGLTVQNNVCTDSTAAWSAPFTNWAFLFAGETIDTVIDHNTIIHTQHGLLAGEVRGDGNIDFVFTNNLARAETYGVFYGGVGSGTPALNTLSPLGYTFSKNAISGIGAATYPSNNFYPTDVEWEAQFIAYSPTGAGANYRLVPGSPYKLAGLDLLDLGADIDALELAIAGVDVGSPAPPPPPPPPSGGLPTVPLETLTADRFVFSNGCEALSGSGTPEANVAGKVCDTFWRSDTGQLYYKVSGSGPNGWVTWTPASTANALVSRDASGNTAVALLSATGISNSGNYNGLGYVGHPSYASQATRWRIDDIGAADFRYVFTDELHARMFVADLEMVLAGVQTIGKSLGILSTNYTVPAAGAASVITFKDLPSAEGMALFESGDWIQLRSFSRSAGELTIASVWGQVSNYSDQTGGTQTWTFTRGSGANGGTLAAGSVIQADAVALDWGVSGNGVHQINAIDGLNGINSPYSEVIRWSGASPIAANQTVMMRAGNLRGLTGTTGEYGFIAGAYSATNGRFIKSSNVGLDLHGVDLSMWQGTTKTMFLSQAGPSFALGATVPSAYGTGTGCWMGNDGGTYKFRCGIPGSAGVFWDGSTLSVVGAITATTGTIGGWSIGATSLSATSGTVGMSSAITGGDDIRFWAGDATPGNAEFYVTESGALRAQSGEIGGWTLGATFIKDTAGLVGMSSLVTGGDDTRFWAGDTDPDDGLFKVTESGVLTATNATFSGSTWTGGSISVASGGVLIDGSGITLAEGTSSVNRIKWGAGSYIMGSDTMGITTFHIVADVVGVTGDFSTTANNTFSAFAGGGNRTVCVDNNGTLFANSGACP